VTTGDARFEEDWRRRFERFANARDDDAGIAGWSESGLAARYRQFVRIWQDEHRAARPTGRWLDAGCGAGTYTRYLAQQQLQVTAIDYSEPTTRKARDRSHGKVDWAVADATCLPFADGSLDGALCFGVMQALSSPQRALAELHRVLRPGGELWVDALNAECLPNAVAEARRRRRGTPEHLRYDRSSGFVAALRSSGFGAIRVHWVPVVPERMSLVQALAEGRILRGLLRVPPIGAWFSHSLLAVAVAEVAAA
jgi:SAM-dependent methyltransferase